MEEIKIRYKNHNIKHIHKIKKGDWIDLRTVEDCSMDKGEFKIINLGVAMQLPKGYEAHLAPRSSTFKNYKILQTNSIGVIDSSYCGNDDWWGFPAYAVEDTWIPAGTRIAQFRIMPVQPEIEFVEVDFLSEPNRGGFGSTGRS